MSEGREVGSRPCTDKLIEITRMTEAVFLEELFEVAQALRVHCMGHKKRTISKACNSSI